MRCSKQSSALFLNKQLVCYSVKSIFLSSSKTTSLSTLIYVPFIPEDLDSITPALSNFLSALTITERVIPTLSGNLACDQNPLVAVKFLENMLDSLKL